MQLQICVTISLVLGIAPPKLRIVYVDLIHIMNQSSFVFIIFRDDIFSWSFCIDVQHRLSRAYSPSSSNIDEGTQDCSCMMAETYSLFLP